MRCRWMRASRIPNATLATLVAVRQVSRAVGALRLVRDPKPDGERPVERETRMVTVLAEQTVRGRLQPGIYEGPVLGG